MSTDWMPGRREEQIALGHKWIEQLPVHNGAWTVTPAEIGELGDLVDEAERWHKEALTGGPVAVARAREECAAMVRYMRFLHGRKFFSPPMEDSDYTRLGLKPPDRTRTEHVAVNELIEFEVKLRGIRELVIDFRIKGAAHKAKPDGYEGAVIVWDIPPSRPERPTDLAHHTMASRTPYVIEFDETERGKTAYIALQWQNERGNTGPWSEIQTAVVP